LVFKKRPHSSSGIGAKEDKMGGSTDDEVKRNTNGKKEEKYKRTLEKE
jgi:hypothetical protein